MHRILKNASNKAPPSILDNDRNLIPAMFGKFIIPNVTINKDRSDENRITSLVLSAEPNHSSQQSVQLREHKSKMIQCMKKRQSPNGHTRMQTIGPATPASRIAPADHQSFLAVWDTRSRPQWTVLPLKNNPTVALTWSCSTSHPGIDRHQMVVFCLNVHRSFASVSSGFGSCNISCT
jgi:hypothetical protein